MRLKSDPGSPKAARDLVESAAARAGFDSDAGLFDLRLATSEVVANALEQKTGELEIGCEFEGGEARVEIRPSGFHEPLTFQDGPGRRVRLLTRAADSVTIAPGPGSATVLLRKRFA